MFRSANSWPLQGPPSEAVRQLEHSSIHPSSTHQPQRDDTILRSTCMREPRPSKRIPNYLNNFTARERATVYCATNAASSATLSPSGFVNTICCAPAATAGVTSDNVFISLNVAATAFPPKVTFVPD